MSKKEFENIIKKYKKNILKLCKIYNIKFEDFINKMIYNINVFNLFNKYEFDPKKLGSLIFYYEKIFKED